MDLLIPAIEIPNLSEARDAASQELSWPVFLGRNESRPIVPFPVFPLNARPSDTPRPGHIEDKNTAWMEDIIDMAEKTKQPSLRIAAIEDIVETLSKCGNRDTPWQLGG